METRTKKYLAASGAVAVGVTGVVGGFAAFTDVDDADTGAESGNVDITFTEDGTATFTAGADNTAPGDSWQRSFTIDNQSSLDLASLTVVVTADGDLDFSNALTSKVEECTVAWTDNDTTGDAPDYSCTGGTSKELTGDILVLQNGIDIGAVAAEQDVFLLVTTTFNPAPGGTNDLQDKEVTLTYDFEATQRTGGAQ